MSSSLGQGQVILRLQGQKVSLNFLQSDPVMTGQVFRPSDIKFAEVLQWKLLLLESVSIEPISQLTENWLFGERCLRSCWSPLHGQDLKGLICEPQNCVAAFVQILMWFCCHRTVTFSQHRAGCQAVCNVTRLHIVLPPFPKCFPAWFCWLDQIHCISLFSLIFVLLLWVRRLRS